MRIIQLWPLLPHRFTETVVTLSQFSWSCCSRRRDIWDSPGWGVRCEVMWREPRCDLNTWEIQLPHINGRARGFFKLNYTEGNLSSNSHLLVYNATEHPWRRTSICLDSVGHNTTIKRNTSLAVLATLFPTHVDKNSKPSWGSSKDMNERPPHTVALSMAQLNDVSLCSWSSAVAIVCTWNFHAVCVSHGNFSTGPGHCRPKCWQHSRISFIMVQGKSFQLQFHFLHEGSFWAFH